jgi:hypothetical protein
MKAYTIIVLAVLVVAGIAYAYRVNSLKDQTEGIPPGVVCTMDAKLCPDGSYVGRQGPNCEFAQCPGTNGTSNSSINASGTIDFEGNVQ